MLKMKIGIQFFANSIILDGQMIVNVIECDEQNASLFDAHYLGESTLGIGDTYPLTDIPIPREPTETELMQQNITVLQLAVAELAETAEAQDIANKLAIAELAEATMGGES